MGLVDELANEENLLADAIKFATTIVEEKRPLVKVRDNEENIKADKGNVTLFTDFRKSIADELEVF